MSVRIACFVAAVLLVLPAVQAPAAPPASAPSVTTAPAGGVSLQPDMPERPSMVSATSQASDEPTTGEVPRKPNNFFGGDNSIIWIMLAGLLLVMFWSSRSRKKQESKRREMLDSLKKGDKIVTIGGVVGTVIEVRPNEVTVKVDESNNVRMRFARWAIRQVGEGPKGDSEEAVDKK